MVNEENAIENKKPTILVCIDTTNASVITLRYACLQARRLGYGLQILSIIEPSHKNLLFGSHAIGQEKRKNLEKYLQKLLDESYKEGMTTPVVSIREGDIATEILREIKSMQSCAMLVFGKSHSLQSDNNVLPKIAQKVGTKIRIPIMIIPENLDLDLLDKLIV